MNGRSLNADRAAALFLISRGLAGLAWSMPLSTLLFSTRAVLDGAFIPIRIPAYMFCAILTACSARRLEEGLGLLGADPRSARILFVIALIQLYMAPFFIWFESAPGELFFMGNFMALIVALLAGMLLANIVAGQVLSRLRGQGARRRVVVPVGMTFAAVVLLPGLLGVDVVGTSAMADWCRYFIVRLLREPWWLIIGLNIPALLTMQVCAYARNTTLDTAARED